MVTIVKGIPLVLGVREPRPIHGAPPGRMRLRMRNNATAKVFVKTDAGVRCFLLEDRGEYWFCSPRLEQGRNATMWRGRNGSEGTDGLQASELESAKQAVLEARGIEPGAED